MPLPGHPTGVDNKMPAQIALHIGAHKTATTHLQRSLSEQSDALARVGARFYGPPYFRNGPEIAERFGLTGAVSADAAQDAFKQMAGDAKRVILSEENFIGTMHNRFARMAFPLYPKAQDRISALAKMIAPDGFDVFLGLRNPATYITSCYCQALLGGRKVVLDEVKAHNRIDAIDWADLVARIKNTPGVRSLTVWRYEDYTALFPRITQDMTGAKIAPRKERVHPGLSQDAVARILMRYADGKGRNAAIRARDMFPAGPDHRAFDAFDAEEHDAAATQYAAQINQIAAMGDVTLLKA